MGFKIEKLTLVRIVIISIPSYAVAFMTEKIFYVVPTIAMMMIIASSIENGNVSNRNRIDDNNSTSEDDASSENITDG